VTEAPVLPGALSRRSFVTAGGLLGAGLLTASCSGGQPRSTPTTVKSSAVSGPELRGDLQMVALAASLENLAVGLYGQAQHALASGRIGPSPAVAALAQSVQDQHGDHANSWNALLTMAGKPKVTGPDPILKPDFDKAFAQVANMGSLLGLMLMLERTLAATQLQALGTVQDPGTIRAAGVIYPVEMQHAAMLRFLLGQYPVPDAFAQLDLARPATDYQA